MYTPITAKLAAEVFSWSQHTEALPPTTMTQLFTAFTAFTLKTLVDHLSTHPVYHKQQLKVTTFGDLPTYVYKPFQDLCRMAYEGILNRQQLVFFVTHLPSGLGLGLVLKEPTSSRSPHKYCFVNSSALTFSLVILASLNGRSFSVGMGGPMPTGCCSELYSSLR